MKKVGSGVVMIATAVQTTVSIARGGVVFYGLYAILGLNPVTIAVPLITYFI